MVTSTPSNIDQSILNAVKTAYGFSDIVTKPLYSYYGGVFEITDESNASYILKVIRDSDKYKNRHLDAEIIFCSLVQQRITEFTTQSFIPDKKGNVLQQIDKNCFYLMKKHEIIKKSILSTEDQQLIGRLMSIFHSKLESFKHDGIGDSSWMRELDNDQYKIVTQHISEEKFAKYIEPLDYGEMKLRKTLIHGDWHGDNMSFTNPPFLYDLDTLCYGSPAEEIARTLTHWDSGVPMKEFHDNLILGYGSLEPHEIALIPRLAIAICCKQFAEVMRGGDEKYAMQFKDLIDEVKHSL